MIKINDIVIDSRAILAPMAGLTDMPYRIINRRHGCKFAFTGMISTRGIISNCTKTLKMLKTSDEDTPLGIQIMEYNTDFLLPALEKLSELNHELLDFNAACPARKIIRRGAGAALLNEPEKLHRMIKLIVKNSHIPVTLKIRTGWDPATINAVDIAKLAQDSGISALFIHGRTYSQGFSGNIDYNTIYKVNRAVSIPVIGSGNIFSPYDAKKMISETGCDAVLIARGSYGNPWIFQHIDYFMETGKIAERTPVQDVANIMAAHFNTMIDFYGEEMAVCLFRKIFVYYTRFFKDIKNLRRKVFTINDKTRILDIIKEFESNTARHITQYE
ncbi:tRNA dihydrouridine synthase DusB [Elusimicrobiota bacterium]